MPKTARKKASASPPMHWRRNNMRHWRLAEGLTLEEVAASLGMTYATIQRYEIGKYNPKPDALERLRALYKAPSIDAMLDGLPQVTGDEKNAPTPSPRTLIIKLVDEADADQQLRYLKVLRSLTD